MARDRCTESCSSPLRRAVAPPTTAPRLRPWLGTPSSPLTQLFPHRTFDQPMQWQPSSRTLLQPALLVVLRLLHVSSSLLSPPRMLLAGLPGVLLRCRGPSVDRSGKLWWGGLLGCSTCCRKYVCQAARRRASVPARCTLRPLRGQPEHCNGRPGAVGMIRIRRGPQRCSLSDRPSSFSRSGSFAMVHQASYGAVL